MNAVKRFPKILIDGVFFQIAHTGIARVWTSLLREWAGNGFAAHLLVLDRGNTAPRLDGVRYLTIPSYDYHGSGLDAVRLQSLCDREQADLFVSTYYTAPLTTPSVFVAYDMIPEVTGHDLDGPMWREKHYGVQHASAHVAISHSTARDLAKFFPEIEVNSVTVAYPGVDAVFRPASGGEIEQFRAHLHLEKPYFLLVGSRVGFNGYKNAPLFFQALAMLPQRQRFAVVCAGGGATLEPILQPLVADAEIHALALSDDELRAAYSGATALVYPSRYEGFGLPVAEAMACGCPVITCRNSSLIEVAGEAALFVPETDTGAMAAALERVQDAEVRRTLIAAGKGQAMKFTWRDMAATLEDLMRRTAGAACGPLRIWPEFRRIQAIAQGRPEIEQQLQRTEYEFAQLRAVFQKDHYELCETKRLLAHMQASRFWKARSMLAQSKKTLLKLATNWLPRRAG
jgi:glycosyltransferase involved in cell wall biosynthesis